MNDDLTGGSTAPADAGTGTASPPVQPSTPSDTAAPAVPGTGVESTDSTREGFIPRARFDEVNTRMQRAEASAKEFQRYRTQLEAMERAQRDPVSYALELMEELGNHPDHSKALRSQAGRLLRAARLQTPPEDAEPGPDLQADNGELVYSARQQQAWAKWHDRQSEAALNARLQPLEQSQTEQQQKALAMQVQAEAHDWARNTLTERRQWPHYKDHERDIKQRMVDHPDWSDERAYIDLLQTDILPNLSKTEQTKVLSDLKQKATAGAVNPGSPTGGHAFKPKSFREALEYFNDHPEEAAALAHK